MREKKILIVDDEKYVLEMIQMRLLEEGYDVSISSNPEDGIRKAIDIKPDLIIMDLIMQDMSGIDAIKILKLKPQTKNIPVIVLTGKTLEEDKSEAIKAGATGFISKPILPNRLIQEIEKFFIEPIMK
ncbi:MAG: response regulator receiver protein [uncultured bacterium]|nr:MAG: response regulator receiver protein [uncultured bacterium]